MKRSTFAIASLAWFCILLLAVLNGALREKLLVPALGPVLGLVASGLILCICVAAVALLATPRFGTLSSRDYWMVGLFWLVLTLAFEFSFGYFAQHQSLQAMLESYAFRGGNLWPFVLLTTFVSPRVSAKVLRLA